MKKEEWIDKLLMSLKLLDTDGDVVFISQDDILKIRVYFTNEWILEYDSTLFWEDYYNVFFSPDRGEFNNLLLNKVSTLTNKIIYNIEWY